MKLKVSDEEVLFRQQIRTFFENEYPADLLAKVRSGKILSRDEHLLSQQALQARGWFAVGWPVDYGGPGWSATQRYIFDEELERVGAPNVIPMAVIYVGPVIYTFGTELQKKLWLPNILESRVMWAQGYSEPDAGSDLAALSFRAERDGDYYVLNGTKIWTSYAQWADWIFCLARTSRSERKQDGISFICADMKTPGIVVHPIITIDGIHHLNQVDFVDVRVPIENRIGDEGQGWHYATFLLANERLSYAHVSRKKEDVKYLYKLASQTVADDGGSMLENPLFLHRLVALEIEIGILQVSVQRVLTARTSASAAEVSSLKIFATECAQHVGELYVELAGRANQPSLDRRCQTWTDRAPATPPFAVSWTSSYLFDRAQTIYGGATEVQKNIIWRDLSR